MLRDIRAIQINMEARVLNVSTDWFERIGIDLDMYFNTNDDLRQQQLAMNPLGHLSDFFGEDGTLRDPLLYGGFDQVPILANNRVAKAAKAVVVLVAAKVRRQPVLQRHPVGRHHF